VIGETLMAYDEGLAERIREVLQEDPGVTEKRMFGGLAFLTGGYMFVGIVQDQLMARVGPAEYEQALGLPHVREMDFTGKPMKGYLYVDPPGFEADADLAAWVRRCQRFVEALPPKEASWRPARGRRGP
jgi:TfoX/Sxy family transcriptional regulator of competence genes